MNSFCPWESAQYLVYSSNVPDLLYYSHLPAIIAALIIGLLVYSSNRKSLIGKVLLSLFITFSIWTIIDIILWATNDPGIVLFFWSLQIMTEIAIFLFALYLVKVYVGEEKLSNKVILFLTILLMPVLVIIPTQYNISGVTLADCFAVESELIIYLSYIIEIFFSLWIIKLLYKYNRIGNSKSKEIKYFTIGISLFLVAFSFGNIIGSFTDNWLIAQYGLFGMPVFVSLLTYIIVKYQTFNIKLLATRALVWGLAILIGSQFLFTTIIINYVLIGITLLLFIILGNFLIKSVKREVEQREKLEVLRYKLEESNIKLEEANDKLKDLDKLKTEFLSLASHQLRSPLTAMKGYSSMIIEGDFGEINPKAKEAVERIFQSTMNLTKIVEDFLNVSKIESGGMKYEMTPFSLAEIARDMSKDLSITAGQKGLKLNFESDTDEQCTVNGDREKIRQVVLNFIDNSIKYTKEGSVNVSVRKVADKVVFAVKDTGMGMTPEIKATLFQKFARGDGARMNTGGSGLGLYLAKEIIEAHKGTVGVESEGMGKGSTFHFELDVTK